MPAPTPRLTAESTIRIALKENPTIQKMRAAAAAAASKFPQVVSLDDPVVGVSTAPGSLWSNSVDFAARVEVAQKIPLGGKREIRGLAAQSDASAAAREIDEARLQLVEAVRVALADYYLAERALQVNRETQELLREMKQDAATRYKNLLAPQQDMLQADVEIADQEERAVAIRRAAKVAQARLNTLMHHSPDAPLGAAPDVVRPAAAPANVLELRRRAMENRPDVRILADRIAADEAAVALAEREYVPDVEVIAAYDGFWQGTDRPLQWQVGARINVPIRTGRRAAAVAEAQARVGQRRAELARLLDQVAFEIQEAYERLREQEQAISLFEKSLLPAATANVKEARVSYATGKVPFIGLVEAQRRLTQIRDRYYAAIAEAARRRAILERAAGTAPPGEE